MAIVDFLYHGEANVCQENLDSFLALAEELKLKGLSGNTQREKEPEVATMQNRKAKLKQENSRNSQAQHLQSKFKEAPPKGSFNETTVALTNDKISVDLQDLDGQIKSMITKSEISAGPGYRGYMASCNVCGKEGPYFNMPNHVETNHTTCVTHACDVCGKISRSKNGLRQHISNSHGSRPPKMISGLEEH